MQNSTTVSKKTKFDLKSFLTLNVRKLNLNIYFAVQYVTKIETNIAIKSYCWLEKIL